MDVPAPGYSATSSNNPNKRIKTSFPPEKEKSTRFNYNFIPSLEHIARVNVLLLAWNSSNIRNHIKNLFTCNSDRRIPRISSQWRQVDAKVIDIIKQLHLPKSLIEPLLCYSESIGKPIVGWVLYYDCMIFRVAQGSDSVAVRYLDQLVWTPRGTIDYIKTARAILNRSEITDTERYLIACTFCLENEVLTYAQNVANKDVYKHARRTQPMAWYWTYYTDGKINELQQLETRFTQYESIYHCLIDVIIYSTISICGENDTAVKYIWNKLSDLEKERLIKPLLDLCCPECCCYSLSQTSESLEQKILRKYSHNVLELFIKNNLWVDHITTMVLYMLEYLTEESYSEIMKLLTHIIKYYRKNMAQYSFMYDKYVGIFYELWQNSATSYKSDIFERDDHLGARVIHALSWESSANVIRSIFSEITPIQRRDVVESKFGIKKCVHFLMDNEESLFEEFVTFGFSEEQEKKELKKKIMKRYRRKIFTQIKTKQGWTGLKEFLVWFFNLLPNEDSIEFWNCMHTISEEYFSTVKVNNEIQSQKVFYESKAQLLIYYLCDESFTSKHPNEKGDENCLELREMLNWYSKPLYVQLPLCDLGESILQRLIHFSVLEENYTLADNILKIYFAEKHLSVMDFRKAFFSAIDNENLIFKFILKDDEFKSLERYINWCFRSMERKKLNDDLLYPDYFIRLIMSFNYRLIDDYVKWLQLPREDLVNLKKVLMNYGNICEIASKIIDNEINEFESTLKIRKLIEWIDPTVETIDLFFESYEEECPLDLYCLLSQFRYEKRSDDSD